MDLNNKPVQTIIPEKIVAIAKAIQDAERNGQYLMIGQKRQWGKRAAMKLAQGEQVLPTNLVDHN